MDVDEVWKRMANDAARVESASELTGWEPGQLSAQLRRWTPWHSTSPRLLRPHPDQLTIDEKTTPSQARQDHKHVFVAMAASSSSNDSKRSSTGPASALSRPGNTYSKPVLACVSSPNHLSNRALIDSPASPQLDDYTLTPAALRSIEVHGATNTRRSLLDHVFKPVIQHGSSGARTFGELVSSLNKATDKLFRFDIFKEDSIRLFVSDAHQGQPGLQPDTTELDVSISLKEKSRLVFTAGTDFGNAEGSAYTNAIVRNIFGGAETLSINASTGTRTRSAYNAALSAPVNGNPYVRLALEGLRSSTAKPWASHEEHLTGGNLRLACLTGDGDSHVLAYSGVWRQLTNLAAGASPTVRADAGDSLKSSITHTFTRDRRDTSNPHLRQSGYLVRTISELAGWGPLKGDVSFCKSEIELHAAVPLALPGVSIGGGLRMGALYPLPLGYDLAAGRAQPSRINDRFLLGGPTDVRGFKLGGLGPHDSGDSVGGDVFAAGSINMLLPLPRTGPSSPLRIQLFANGGRLVAMKNKGKAKQESAYPSALLDSKTVLDGMKSAVGELTNGLPSMAAGVGLVYAHPVARFELNFSLPLVVRRGEEGRKGLQVGVGINFL
ncbi:mitochondrial outer membrane beta-barrel protein Tob55 [Apodospora peruviana]|uniref:Mitochondrial outer membrane beta-barrel protein Tob55 n=1 Tax=Apodospora peruviana TaxID=516989 RepID=A0AAE0I1N5_9PEZI|nr:mitochondrial outer membrane beta-barrel protein Tob55 [Apodospora peruviana]